MARSICICQFILVKSIYLLKPDRQRSSNFKCIFSWREARSSICRLVTGTVAQAQAQAPQAPNTKLSITHSFFELQSPDFAWKFVWTVRTNLKIFFKMADKIQNDRQIAKLCITRSFLELQSPNFAWKLVWIVQKTKWPPNRKIEHNSLIS